MYKKNNLEDEYSNDPFLCRNGEVTIRESCLIRQEFIPEIYGCKYCDRRRGAAADKKQGPAS